jgi:MraZ protein
LAFRSQYEHSLDTKDRITIPAKHRAAFHEGVILSAGLDPCVEAWPLDAYESFEQRHLSGLSPLGRDARVIKRRLYALSEEESLDSSGRVRLPGHLVDHAKLEGPCVVVGAGDHLEMWSPREWQPEEREMDARGEEIAEGLAGRARSGGEES